MCRRYPFFSEICRRCSEICRRCSEICRR
ncbi:four-helix bundle copper-binding protein [Bacteroides uniformis]